ncbi:crotonase/enoyl-CoA hydratase family protein [Tahibacter amnicola]|uniref:Crotonase/enoyl-CoA hydratase family protein n=1 Tax=Tahibacter amnicola TaxID=2976241 RepID=A0ABY6B7A5_9GAMM|nr:crotonase/enoyl-CoA hydratase family protein [Tahibacter amnicola]UXI65774.1 crotonase/enoyl-CoA hydratase family protein [Tahibacter amnicola]
MNGISNCAILAIRDEAGLRLSTWNSQPPWTVVRAVAGGRAVWRSAIAGLESCGTVFRMSILLVEHRDSIALVRLNRPDKRNAISFQLLRELDETARQLRRDHRLRAVILCGAGESFSSGIDLSDLAEPRHRLWAAWQLIKPGRSLFQQAFLTWQEMPVPVLAAVHGHCFGAGLQLALAADIRFAAPDCQLSIMESRWGLVPDMGLTRSLRGVVHADVARELTYTARIVRGDEAQPLGLVTHVTPDPLAAAMALAQEIAQRSPDAVLAAKRVLDAMQHQPRRALRLEKLWQLRLLRGRNAAVARKRATDPETPFAPREYD